MEISPIVIARAHRLGSLQRFRSRQHVSRRPIIVGFKVSKGAKIRNRYNQVPHLTQDTNGKVTNSQ